MNPNQPKPKVVFVANCLLNQYMRARGVKNTYKKGERVPGIVEPLMDLLEKYNVAVEQMPCIEVYYEGLVRTACGQNRYNKEDFKRLCEKYAGEIVYLIGQYEKAGYDVRCIIGMDGSPTCGVDLTALGGGKWARDRGIFMKILEERLKKNGYNIPMIGARLKSNTEINRFLRDVEQYLR